MLINLKKQWNFYRLLFLILKVMFSCLNLINFFLDRNYTKEESVVRKYYHTKYFHTLWQNRSCGLFVKKLMDLGFPLWFPVSILAWSIFILYSNLKHASLPDETVYPALPLHAWPCHIVCKDFSGLGDKVAEFSFTPFIHSCNTHPHAAEPRVCLSKKYRKTKPIYMMDKH